MCLCVAVTNHYYTVAFLPEHTTEDPPSKEMQNYRRLYSSKRFQSFIKIFPDTVAASKCTDRVKVKYLPVDTMLGEASGMRFINEHSVDLALGPLTAYNTADRSFFSITVHHEEVKNHFFIQALSYILPSFFHLGHIEVPRKNAAYSKYGRLRQDTCVMHEKYASPVAAVLSWVDLTNEEDYNYMDIDEDDECEEVDARAGTFEYKNQGYKEQQGLKEMMCVAGDLVAKVLITGKRPANVTIYGMAADYATKEGKLLKLDIDFDSNKGIAYCSKGTTRVSKGLNWMLSEISPRVVH